MDDLFWKNTFKEAQKAQLKKEVPVGCIIVHNNDIIAKAHNLKETTQDCTAHAEILAIKKAQKKLNSWRLNNCNLYVTLEPCPMCAGAILHARINTIFYATKDSRWGAETKLNMFSKQHFNHKVDHYYIEKKESLELLQNFFKQLREKK